MGATPPRRSWVSDAIFGAGFVALFAILLFLAVLVFGADHPDFPFTRFSEVENQGPPGWHLSNSGTGNCLVFQIVYGQFMKGDDDSGGWMVYLPKYDAVRTTRFPLAAALFVDKKPAWIVRAWVYPDGSITVMAWEKYDPEIHTGPCPLLTIVET